MSELEEQVQRAWEIVDAGIVQASLGGSITHQQAAMLVTEKDVHSLMAEVLWNEEGSPDGSPYAYVAQLATNGLADSMLTRASIERQHNGIVGYAVRRGGITVAFACDAPHQAFGRVWAEAFLGLIHAQRDTALPEETAVLSVVPR